MTETLFESTLESLPLIGRGKVRDNYAVDDDHLLIVASDRLSAFDVVLPTPIPGKGAVLTALSHFWFARTGGIVANHLSDMSLEDAVPDATERAVNAALAADDAAARLYVERCTHYLAEPPPADWDRAFVAKTK